MLNKIPDVSFVQVFSFLEVKETVLVTARVNKLWKRLSDDNGLWKLLLGMNFPLLLSGPSLPNYKSIFSIKALKFKQDYDSYDPEVHQIDCRNGTSAASYYKDSVFSTSKIRTQVKGLTGEWVEVPQPWKIRRFLKADLPPLDAEVTWPYERCQGLRIGPQGKSDRPDLEAYRFEYAFVYPNSYKIKMTRKDT